MEESAALSSSPGVSALRAIKGSAEWRVLTSFDKRTLLFDLTLSLNSETARDDAYLRKFEADLPGRAAVFAVGLILSDF